MKKLTRKNYYEKLIRGGKKRRKVLSGGAQAMYHNVFAQTSPFYRNFPIISLLGSDSLRKSLKRAIIQAMNRDEMDAIDEIIQNFLAARIPVTDSALRTLRRDRLFLYRFLKRKGLKGKKKDLGQRGGFLSALIPLASSVVAPLVSGLFGKLLK